MYHYYNSTEQLESVFMIFMDIKIRTNIHSDLFDMFVASFVKIDWELSVRRGTDSHFVQKTLIWAQGSLKRMFLLKDKIFSLSSLYFVYKMI